MRRHEYYRVPANVLLSHLKWLSAAQAGLPADPKLLIAGLCKDDPDRWEIGVLDAEIGRDADDGSPIVKLLFAKETMRPGDAGDPSPRLLDPEGAFALLAHCWFQGRLDLKDSVSSDSRIEPDEGVFLYLALTVRGTHFVRAQRLIADTQHRRASKLGPNYHDYRRRALPPRGETKPVSRAKHGREAVRSGDFTRREKLIQAALSKFQPGVIPGVGTTDAYRQLLLKAYDLLDQHPLGQLPQARAAE